MIDTKAIRKYLLESAIRGRLTDNGNDSISTLIISNIEEEYQGLIACNGTKAKVKANMITEDLFEIPATWNWYPLSKLCLLLSRGKSPKYSDIKRYPVFAQKCNQPTGLALDRALFLDETTLDKWQSYFRLRDGDILINSTGTGTMGRVGIFVAQKLNPDYSFMVPDSHVTVARIGKGIVPKYIYYALRSPSLQKIMEKQFRGTTNQKEFYIDSVASMPIPLPSTEVQEHITALLDESFSVLDTIDALQAKYADNLTALKAKLIDAAIQGKLTEQLPEDGTAEELYEKIQEEKQALIKAGKIKKKKPQLEIYDNEFPFDIPSNWKWVPLGELISIESGRGLTAVEMKPGRIPVYGGNGITGHHDCGFVPEGTVVIGRVGYYCGSVHVTEQEAWVTDNAFITIYPEQCLDKWFLVHTLRHMKLGQNNNGSAQPVVSGKKIYPLAFPLPPLAEQRRIAARLEEILPMCED